MELRFAPTETALDYFEATRAYLRRHDKPVCFYSDEHSIFRVSQRSPDEKVHTNTQFGRALDQLNIDIICANTPQAKGRVERANRTLQGKGPIAMAIPVRSRRTSQRSSICRRSRDRRVRGR